MPFAVDEPSVARFSFSLASRPSSIFHQRGLASILQRTHFRSGLATIISGDGSSLIVNPALDGRPRAERGVDNVTVDVRRLPCTGAGTDGGTLVDWSTRLAFRAVPVKVKSACLNSRAKS